MTKTSLLFIGFSILLIALILFDILIGSFSISFNDFLQYLVGNPIKPEIRKILSEFRIPKTKTAVIAGAALSVAGLQMQTIFRNPLAGPYVLGISAGAGLGVALVLLSPLPLYIFSDNGMNWLTIISAWIGSGLILFIIFIFSLKVKDVVTILIIGILLGSAMSSVISILQFLGEKSEVKTFIIWTMGSLSGVSNEQLNILFPAVTGGLIISLLSARFLNILLLGENYASGSGLNLKTTRFIIFLSTGILAGSVTAFCGPIGFVGIIVPHIARMVFKTALHQVLIPASAIIGAVLILFSDILSQLPLYNGMMPINSVTAVLGIPIVIYILLKNKI
jgi:iron complex transport system permease protein